MNYILFDDSRLETLKPLSYTQPVGALRIGILTFQERWEKLLGKLPSLISADYLAAKYPTTVKSENILINSGVIASSELTKNILQLDKRQELRSNKGTLLAIYLTDEEVNKYRYDGVFPSNEKIIFDNDVIEIKHPWDIFIHNATALNFDFQLITHKKKSQPLNSNNRITDNIIFLEEGAKVNHSILNSESGPIYIGKNAEVMEGCMIRGPFALGEGSTLKMGTKIYGATTFGPHCKVGGEVSNSVIQGYSNKGHDGFLGNSVLGQWCNLGADTNGSNLKNNYSSVRVWSYEEEKLIDSNQQFVGLIMGDYSKCSINTMFNTGTVVGVNANIFGSGFPPKFIPSFSWGGAEGFAAFDLKKAYKIADKVCQRRKINFTEEDKTILKHVFNVSAKYRG